MPIKKCPQGKIVNPITNRCVKIDGRIGKKLSDAQEKSLKRYPTDDYASFQAFCLQRRNSFLPHASKKQKENVYNEVKNKLGTDWHDILANYVYWPTANIHVIKNDQIAEDDMDKFNEGKKNTKVTKTTILPRDIKRGDIVAFKHLCGYRNDGKCMYDGKKLVPFNFEYDDYGMLPFEFNVISGEFPVNYWSVSYECNEQVNSAIDHNCLVPFNVTNKTLKGLLKTRTTFNYEQNDVTYKFINVNRDNVDMIKNTALGYRIPQMWMEPFTNEVLNSYPYRLIPIVDLLREEGLKYASRLDRGDVALENTIWLTYLEDILTPSG
jgi:hypothetical protein